MKLNADLVYGFATSLLSQRYDDPKPTPEFHRELWSYCTAPDEKVAIAAPRGHAKSTAVTHAYVLAAVLFREADFVVIVSDTELQAIQFLNDIKMELTENIELRQLFKFKKFLREAEKDITCELGPDGHKFRIMVRGASGGSGSVRGFKWRGKRPNLIVCDDMENDEAVKNEERRAKFREWFFGALIPALSDKGKIRIVGTVLHFDSLLERLMPDETGDEAKYTIHDDLRIYSDKDDLDWLSIKYRAHTENFEKVLWPEKFSRERLEKIRRDYVNQGIPEGYSQEYLNFPIDESSAFFRRDDFLDMTEEDHDRYKIFYAAIDPAISEKEKRSYTAIVVGGVDDEGYLYIIKVIRERMDAKQIIDEILAVHKRYDPEIFVIEEGALKKSMGPFLHEQMMKTGIFPNIRAMVPTKDKQSRARSIQARMRAGSVKFDKQAEWYPSLEQEMLRFDRGEYDDQVDAMAWIGLILAEMAQTPTREELDEMEYEEEVWESEGGLYNQQQGQSEVTGY